MPPPTLGGEVAFCLWVNSIIFEQFLDVIYTFVSQLEYDIA